MAYRIRGGKLRRQGSGALDAVMHASGPCIILVTMAIAQGASASERDSLDCFSGPTFEKTVFIKIISGATIAGGPVKVTFIILDKNGKEYAQGTVDFKACEQNKKLRQIFSSEKINFKFIASAETAQRISIEGKPTISDK